MFGHEAIPAIFFDDLPPDFVSQASVVGINVSEKVVVFLLVFEKDVVESGVSFGGVGLLAQGGVDLGVVDPSRCGAGVNSAVSSGKISVSEYW